MRRFFLSLLLAALCFTAQAKDRVVEHPSCQYNNSDLLSVERVTLSPTATTVTFSVGGTSAFSISPSVTIQADGKSYQATAAEGITFGETQEIQPGSSATFSVSFQPLPDNAKNFDFSEGNDANHWRIYGIRLDGKAPKLSLPQSLKADKKASADILKPIDYRLCPTSIHGHLIGYEPGMIIHLAYDFTDLFGENQLVELPIRDDGTFEATTNVWGPTNGTLVMDGRSISMTLAPAQDNKVTIVLPLLGNDDVKEKAVAFEGPYDGLNDEQYRLNIKPMLLFSGITSPDNLSKMKGMTAADYKAFILGIYGKAVADVKNNGNISDTYRDIVLASYEEQLFIYQPAVDGLLSYVNQSEAAIDIPNDYWDNLCATRLIGSPAVPFTPFAYNVDDLLNQVSNKCPTIRTALETRANLPQNVAQRMMSQLKDFQPLTEEQLKELDTQAQAFSAYVREKNDQLVKQQEENKKKGGFTIHDISTDLKGEEVFKAIVAPFKGKPVLVDFWATWCGPCRAAMKSILPVKEELAGKAVFVYVSSPTSPRGLWENMITDIHGEHFYVTEEQWGTLLNQFESQGIPTYVVVDKDGQIKSKYIGFPGVAKISGDLKAGM